MLTTNLCRFSICFLHDRKNGNAKRSEFVEFDGRKSNKCSRYRGIFCSSSVNLISLNPHILSVALFSASSAKNASFFLIMNIHLLRGKNANVNLCLFCRLRQHYKVHTYFISMEFSAVNRRRPLAKRHSGRERRRTAVFAGYRKQRFQKASFSNRSLWRAFANGSVFGDRSRRCSVDDSRIRSKTAPFSFENVLVWTGP